MTDSTLGLRLRKILLRQSREHGSLDRRSVQGLVGEVCGSDQQDLLPALRYVVLCEPFLEALRATPPLGDPRLGLRFGNRPGVSTLGLVTFLSFLCGGLAMALASSPGWTFTAGS